MSFLPSDNSLTCSDASQLAASLGTALNAVVSLSDAQFWTHLVHDAQLAACVDSYLRFKARPHDLGAEAVASDQDSALARPVVLLYLRAATPTGDAAAHASLLRRCRLVGVPQLLDFAALFGPSNTQLVARVFTGLLAAAPWLREGIAAAGAAAAENLLQLAQRCADVCEAPFDGDSRGEVLDAAIYFADCGATFAVLVTCCPTAACDLLSGDGASLLHSLAVVYDNALEALSHADFGPQSPAFQAAVTRAQAAVARATWALLRAAFLDPGAGTAASRREALTLSVLSMSSAEAGGGRLLSRLGGCHDIAAVLADAQLGLDATQRAQLLASFAHNAGPARAAAPAGNDAQLQSRIAAVRDVLPDYGDGFVAACLDALGQDAERVMATLLDGSLPAAVAGLDTRLTLTAYRAAAGPSRREQPPRAGRPVPKPRVPAPQEAGYRKHAQRYAWQRDEALELLETRDADVINAARLAAVAAECEAGTDAAEAEGAWPRSLQPLGATNEYDDDFDDEDDSQWGVPAPRLASDDDAEAGGGATAGEAAVPTTSAGSRKFWLFEGRVYTYAKPGATLVMASSAEAAHAIGQAAAAAEKAQIHGLGEGGNRAAPGPATPREAGGRGDGGEGGRGDGGGPGRGRGRGSYARKEQNKGAVGNHHRRDRAAAKQRVLLGSGGT